MPKVAELLTKGEEKGEEKGERKCEEMVVDAKTVFRKRLTEMLAGVATSAARKTNPWHEIRSALATRRPLPILFIGTNGVGKSTSISKCATWLKKKYPELTISMIAGDTYRSGAIEQLQVHGRNLGVNVFAREYGRDPAAVVREGMYKFSAAGNTDVVLIDTAGRFSSTGTDGKAMMEICRMINYVSPYLVMFVAECLTGSDLANQIDGFNRSIQHNCPGGINGVIVTKADAVGEKLGTLLNIMSVCKLPIDFIGTGQNYDDLEELGGTNFSTALLNLVN